MTNDDKQINSKTSECEINTENIIDETKPEEKLEKFENNDKESELNILSSDNISTDKNCDNNVEQDNATHNVDNPQDNENKIKFNKRRNENLVFINSIYTNYLSWIILFICLYKISNNFFSGIITFFLIYFSAYFFHVSAHNYDTFFTKIHEYHHSHTNLFSHIIQLLVELFIPSIFIPFYYYFNFVKNNLDMWVLFFSALFYSSVHNINYGYIKVNRVHSIHHMRRTSNYGPDLCDVLFGTKDILNDNVENTNHHIPNILLVTLLIILLQSEKIFSMDTMKKIALYFSGINMTFLFIVSSVLFYNSKNKNIKKNKIENN